jgi:hypothetical protein
MKEISVRVFDDLDFHRDGIRNEACVTLSIGLNGTWCELDLTEANEKTVRDTLDQLMEAGHDPDVPPVPGAKRGINPEVTARNERIRAWCRENGLRNSSGTGWAYQTNGKLNDYIGLPLIRKYEAHLAAQRRKER